MATLGQQLKEAREKRGITTSQAAAGTNIKAQHLEAMEKDDFSTLTIPAYTKGFIKIYAMYLGLSPEPLIQEYLDVHAPAPIQQLPLLPEEKDDEPEEDEEKGENIGTVAEIAQLVHLLPWRTVILGLSGIVIIVIILSAIGRKVMQKDGDERDATRREERQIDFTIIGEPREPYLDREQNRAELP